MYVANRIFIPEDLICASAGELRAVLRDALKRAKSDPTVARNLNGFVTYCLVPAVIYRLIMEDLGQGVGPALRTQRDTEKLGQFFYENDVVEGA